MKKKLKILDYYVHQAHQYEFFKTGHDFYLVSPSSQKPDWDSNDRPMPSNLTLITEQDAFYKQKIFDVVMVRSPINLKRYTPFIKRGAVPVAVVQTTSPYPIPNSVKNVVWNCQETMETHSSYYQKRKHHYIVHGFDPNEFRFLNLEKKPRVLTIANVFKERANIMGYPLWDQVNRQLDVCDLLGHGNEDIPGALGKAKNFAELINYYNTYRIFFNPTRESAMPRARGESLMCGMANITTPKFDISKYYSHGKNILFAKTPSEVIENINLLLNNPKMAEDLGQKARETAIKKFHIKDYLDRWNGLFESL